ncbi:sensor histidine kinase [Dinghuibacter silviterrae]|nr:PAS domain-containing sensor histidine kinase [Dinghuibacter silviterrae]
MFKERAQHILLSCTVVTLGSALLQYLYPSYTLFDGGLIVAILLTVFLKSDHYTRVFGWTGVALVILASFYSTENADRKQLIFQHLFSLIIIILTTVFILYVKKLYRSIEADQHQFRALFEHATEGIILTDDRGVIVLLNPAGAAMFGYASKELTGANIDKLVPDRFHPAHAGHRDRYYQQPGNRAMGHGRDLFARAKDGTEFPVEVSLSHYRQYGRMFVIAFIVDISQRKQSERELLQLNTGLEVKVEQRTAILREALQELERSQEELNAALSKEKELGEIKSRFVSMASHEFRTPLSTILSSANLLARYTQTEDQDKRDKHIKRTRDAVKHLNNLLDDFLSLGRLEEGKVRAEPAWMSLAPLLEEVTEEMQALAKPGQVIHCNCPDDQLLYSDKRLLKNILVNLLNNASKFSPEGAPIHLEGRRHPDRHITVTVRDNGIGISTEDKQHLFTSFFRGGNALNIEGTGLGLHIVRRYLDLLDGDIWLDSKEGEGTSVTIELPERIG